MRGLALILAAWMLAVPGKAHEWAIDVRDNQWASGVPLDEFEYFKADSVDELDYDYKRELNWSLAACVQMILNHKDLYIGQEDLRYRLFGERGEKILTPSQIIRRLDGWKIKGARVWSSHFKVRKSTIARDVYSTSAVLVGVEDLDVHRNPLPMVLVQVKFEKDYFSRRVPKSVVLLDPWPDGRKEKREMTWYDFSNNLKWALRLSVEGRHIH